MIASREGKTGLRALQAALPRFQAYKASLIAISPHLKDLHLEVFHNDLSTHTADGSWDLPIPATFVIYHSGIERARYVSAEYTTRMGPDDIEAALAALD